MSCLLKDYLQDGANYQARAVLMYIQRFSDIKESWNNELNCYEAEIKVARWENCYEQGYICYLRSKDYSRQLNIAFFEHRNSDRIHAVKWEQHSFNSLNINTAEFKDIYKDKNDTSHSVLSGEFEEMGNWIIEQFRNFWKETSQKSEKEGGN